MSLSPLRTVRDSRFVEVENDFRHSGQGVVQTTAWVADGVTITRMLDLVEFDDRGFQLDLCKECGLPGCKSGGWVRMRRFADHVLFAPELDPFARDRLVSPSHQPPDFLTRAAIPAFDKAGYEAATAHGRGWPPFGSVPLLSPAEAMSLAQIRHPEVFGRFGAATVSLDRDRFLATSEDDLEAALDLLGELIEGLGESGGTRLVEKPERVIEFYIDDEDLSTWAGVAFDAEGAGLYLAPPRS